MPKHEIKNRLSAAIHLFYYLYIEFFLIMKTTNEIRELFLNYFNRNNHEIVPSSPLVPHNDPSLMFTNSGMVQFKGAFLGKEQLPYSKAASSQKCVRAGGKHNDLDNVGYTKRHLTFFEMLGNFSFGDYFKKEAIEYAWDFITKELGLNKSRIYITVYHDDNESFSIWKKVTGFSDSKIIRINTSDNFWSMGDTGPCGPCSEIFYDQGEGLEGGLPGTKNQDGDRYVEIWNLVFMEKNQIKLGEMVNLSHKSIDTGMGLERITSVIQGVYDNFETDVFKLIINNISEITGTKSTDKNRFSHRIIADHLRSSAFLISDGVMPLNEGRGYVLRRIMRRAIRHVHHLKYKDLLLTKLVPVLVGDMGQYFPELIKNQELISEIFKQEEASFRETIDRGIKLIQAKTKDLKPKSTLPGKIAFELHDTYGFPVDITADILKEKNILVDMNEFDKCMDIQKEKARKAWTGSDQKEVQNIWFDIKNTYGVVEFLGYTNHYSQGKVIGLVQDSKKVESVSNNDEFYLVTNQTPFYGESGGQIGDVGTIYDDKLKISVIDTKKPLPGLYAHLCKLKEGSISQGDVVHLKIDVEHRNAIRRSHTATHLLHSSLRDLIGKHVSQRGSLVAEDRLRFDFSHNGAIPRDKLDEIESKINLLILSDAQVKIKLVKYEEAVKAGAMALFGEKYERDVRVVTVGEEDKPHSIELCGGTHISRLGEIGGIKILSESAISSGIRRIEAVTGIEAYNSWRGDYNYITDLSLLLQSKNAEVLDKVSELLKKNKSLEKQLQSYKQSSLVSAISSQDIETINNVEFLFKTIKDIDMGDLRNLLQQYLSGRSSTIGLLFGASGDKVTFVCGVTKDLHSKIGAKSLVKIVADNFNSNGGGNDFMCQGGGTMAQDKIDLSVKEVKDIIKSI